MLFQSRKLALACAVALAVLCTVPAAAAATHGDTPATQAVIDARQAAQIWTAYALSPQLRAHDIAVSVHQGRATLTGRVEEDIKRKLADELALGVDGVKRVDNRITVDADHVSTDSSESSEFAGRADDAAINAAVRSKLAWGKYPGARAIVVRTTRGKVMLTGTAPTSDAVQFAVRLAMDTRGVAAVDNRIVVDPAGNVRSGADLAQADGDMADSWITAKVRMTLMYSSNVDSGGITVNTADGVVTLGGRVDSGAEKARAIELARNVRGVRSVDSAALLL